MISDQHKIERHTIIYQATVVNHLHSYSILYLRISCFYGMPIETSGESLRFNSTLAYESNPHDLSAVVTVGANLRILYVVVIVLSAIILSLVLLSLLVFLTVFRPTLKRPFINCREDCDIEKQSTSGVDMHNDPRPIGTNGKTLEELSSPDVRERYHPYSIRPQDFLSESRPNHNQPNNETLAELHGGDIHGENLVELHTSSKDMKGYYSTPIELHGYSRGSATHLPNYDSLGFSGHPMVNPTISFSHFPSTELK